MHLRKSEISVIVQLIQFLDTKNAEGKFIEGPSEKDALIIRKLLNNIGYGDATPIDFTLSELKEEFDKETKSWLIYQLKKAFETRKLQAIFCPPALDLLELLENE